MAGRARGLSGALSLGGPSRISFSSSSSSNGNNNSNGNGGVGQAPGKAVSCPLCGRNQGLTWATINAHIDRCLLLQQQAAAVEAAAAAVEVAPKRQVVLLDDDDDDDDDDSGGAGHGAGHGGNGGPKPQPQPQQSLPSALQGWHGAASRAGGSTAATAVNSVEVAAAAEFAREGWGGWGCLRRKQPQKRPRPTSSGGNVDDDDDDDDDNGDGRGRPVERIQRYLELQQRLRRQLDFEFGGFDAVYQLLAPAVASAAAATGLENNSPKSLSSDESTAAEPSIDELPLLTGMRRLRAQRHSQGERVNSFFFDTYSDFRALLEAKFPQKRVLGLASPALGMLPSPIRDRPSPSPISPLPAVPLSFSSATEMPSAPASAPVSVLSTVPASAKNGLGSGTGTAATVGTAAGSGSGSGLRSEPQPSPARSLAGEWTAYSPRLAKSSKRMGRAIVVRAEGCSVRNDIDIDESVLIKKLPAQTLVFFDDVGFLPAILEEEIVETKRLHVYFLDSHEGKGFINSGWASLAGRLVQDNDPILRVLEEGLPWQSTAELMQSFLAYRNSKAKGSPHRAAPLQSGPPLSVPQAVPPAAISPVRSPKQPLAPGRTGFNPVANSPSSRPPLPRPQPPQQNQPSFLSPGSPEISWFSAPTSPPRAAIRNCPLCNMTFPSHFTQADCDKHIQDCLSESLL